MPKAFVQLWMTVLRSGADSQSNDFLCRQCRVMAGSCLPLESNSTRWIGRWTPVG